MTKDVPSSVNFCNDVLVLLVYLVQIGLNITDTIRKIELLFWFW